MTSFLKKTEAKICLSNEREGRDGEKIDFLVIFFFLFYFKHSSCPKILEPNVDLLIGQYHINCLFIMEFLIEDRIKQLKTHWNEEDHGF